MTKYIEAHGSDCRARTAHAGLRATVTVACLAASGTVLAQDGVTLYGVIDEFAQYVNTGNGYTAAINSGGQWGSRFGLKGGEDIGGGQKIEFALENGFNPNDGSLASAGSMFNRQAWVGVAGAGGSCARAGRIRRCSTTRAGRTRSAASRRHPAWTT